jgi:hypothetical protein
LGWWPVVGFWWPGGWRVGGWLRRVGVCVGEPLNDVMGVSLRHTAFLRFAGKW